VLRTLVVQSAMLVTVGAALLAPLAFGQLELASGSCSFSGIGPGLIMYHVDYNDGLVPKDVPLIDYLSIFITPGQAIKWTWSVEIGQGYAYSTNNYLSENKNSLALAGLKLWGLGLAYLALTEVSVVFLDGLLKLIGLPVYGMRIDNMVDVYAEGGRISTGPCWRRPTSTGPVSCSSGPVSPTSRSASGGCAATASIPTSHALGWPRPRLPLVPVHVPLPGVPGPRLLLPDILPLLQAAASHQDRRRDPGRGVRRKHDLGHVSEAMFYGGPNLQGIIGRGQHWPYFLSLGLGIGLVQLLPARQEAASETVDAGLAAPPRRPRLLGQVSSTSASSRSSGAPRDSRTSSWLPPDPGRPGHSPLESQHSLEVLADREVGHARKPPSDPARVLPLGRSDDARRLRRSGTKAGRGSVGRCRCPRSAGVFTRTQLIDDARQLARILEDSHPDPTSMAGGGSPSIDGCIAF